MRALLGIAAAALITSAHVGDRNTHFRGTAGPYAVHVVVRHPGVVPGLADITVRVDAAGVRRVTVQPVPSREGLDGAPRPDVAKPVAGEPGLFAAQLWFMTTGAYSVRVGVEGDAGAGTAVVPVASLATRTLGFSAALAVLLLALGLLLAAGLVTIVRAAVRESVLPPGAVPDRARISRARIATAVSIVLLAFALTGGRRWWQAEAAAYRSILYQPLAIRAAVSGGDGDGPVLRIAFVDPAWLARRVSPIVPDHGKRMHAFVVRAGDMAAFAHIHPVPVHTDTFAVPLPPLPAGTYHLYADIVHESGFAETLVDTVRIDAHTAGGADASPGLAADPDDAWWTGAAARPDAVGVPVSVRLRDGTTLEWQSPAGPIVVDRDLTLRFVAREPDGTPSSLEPYMGMFAHAAVHRLDGAVFVHLHPTGTISTAAQRRLGALSPDTRADHPQLTLADGVVELPYAFPMPGEYRVFVQTKRAGTIRTAAFVVVVSAPRGRRGASPGPVQVGLNDGPR